MADENPIPDRITEASWQFMLALLAMEPNTANAGIYANKAHYHNTRKANQANWPGSYSIQHPLDLQGPDDKAAAYDWTHNTAHGGDYRSMRRYGDRLYAAWKARDPRLYGWREAQGMVTGSSVAVDLNFAADGWRQGGTPADSHKWHWHLSEHRAFVESWHNKLAMLSILRGESLADYLARGGELLGDNDTGGDMYAAQSSTVSHAAMYLQEQLLAVINAEPSLAARLPEHPLTVDGKYGARTAYWVSVILTGGTGVEVTGRWFARLDQMVMDRKIAASGVGQGPPGPQGPAGPAGPAGEPGKTPTQVTFGPVVATVTAAE